MLYVNKHCNALFNERIKLATDLPRGIPERVREAKFHWAGTDVYFSSPALMAGLEKYSDRFAL